MKRNLGALIAVVAGIFAMSACVVVDDDYVCDDGEVLVEAGNVACDGYVDCYDGSDEWQCGADDYVCDDGQVLVAAGDVSCDEVADCDDYSDEFACGGCLSDEVACDVNGVPDCGVVCDGVDECDNFLDEPAVCP